MIVPGSPGSFREDLVVTKTEVARAAGVADQAVSNWIRRYEDFPHLITQGRRVGYSATAVAAWLDRRTIPRNVLRPGEQAGATYGQRFRKAVGLPVTITKADVQQKDQLKKRLWERLEELRKDVDRSTYQQKVMALLCLQSIDPVGWTQISRATTDTIKDAVDRVWSAQRDQIREATAIVREELTDYWRRDNLVRIVAILTSEVQSNAVQHGPPSLNRVSAAEAFDYLLDRFAAARRESMGEFFTPPELARLMAEIAKPTMLDRVHNPCCNSGELLVAAEHVRRASAETINLRFSGRALSPSTWRLASMNLAVHGVGCDLGASPQQYLHEISVDPDSYDVVLMNPPFNMGDWHAPQMGSKQLWPFGAPPRHSANFAWLQLGVMALSPEGRAVVVMPSSAGDPQNPRERSIRDVMVDRGVVRSVIALPKYLFRETTAAVSLWVLGPSDKHPRKGEVLFVDARSAVCSEGRTHRILTHVGSRNILAAYQSWVAGAIDSPIAMEEVAAAAVTIDQVRQNDYDLNPSVYLYQLAAGSWKPQPTPTLQALRDELSQLRATAVAADRHLDLHLDRIRPWTP